MRFHALGLIFLFVHLAGCVAYAESAIAAPGPSSQQFEDCNFGKDFALIEGYTLTASVLVNNGTYGCDFQSTKDPLTVFSSTISENDRALACSNRSLCAKQAIMAGFGLDDESGITEKRILGREFYCYLRPLDVNSVKMIKESCFVYVDKKAVGFEIKVPSNLYASDLLSKLIVSFDFSYCGSVFCDD